MSDIIMDTNVLQEILFSRIKTKKVKVHEENGIFTVTPVTEEQKNFDHLVGMFSDGKLSIDNYLKEKQLDKELEQ